MKTIDYIIVGCGLAGVALCERLRVDKRSFVVFDNNSQYSSLVAAGLYNPVVLKRFTPVWKAAEQLQMALPVYKKIEHELNIKIDYKLQILRRFASVEEQNQWFNATDKPKLEAYMSTHLLKNDNPNLLAPFGFGEVLHAGRLDTALLINSYKDFLTRCDSLVQDGFQYDRVMHQPQGIVYGNIKAKHLIFSEGFGIKQNPFFKQVPLNGTKGEVLTLHIPDLKMDYAIKSSVFVIPIGNDLYKVGSTYNREDKTNDPTRMAKEELLHKVETFLNAKYTVVEHLAGVRPTVKDRRPLVGRHSQYSNIYILNGLGSRGVMIAPYVADKLFRFIEKHESLDPEIDSNRFN